MGKSKLTTAAGIPIGEDQHSITAGERGPVLLQDHHLIEKLAHFNREKVAERIVHAKGFGAYGSLKITHDISKYTNAKIFQRVGQETEAFLRFSTVAGEKGSADTERDPRGFAVKFYTEEGVWDLVGNNTPVFFERDPLKFPDFIHSQKRDPKKGYKDPKRMWDYWAKAPQAMHQIMILFSDRGIPDGFRFMHGYGSHTYSFWNKQGETFWVKFHFKSLQGIKNLTAEMAAQLAGEDPDYAGRDLFESIERGDYPRWSLKVQVMPEKAAENFAINPFDLTKVWPHADYPLIDVGILELNKNPEDYFSEVEQSAFSPANLVPGIGPSPDKMLQARLFAYPDAHRYRIGANYQALPVNKSKSPINNYQRDGNMRFDGNQSSYDNYGPNGFQGPAQDANVIAPPLSISGATGSYDAHAGNDDYTQAGNLYRLLPEDEKARLTKNLAGTLSSVDKQTLQVLFGYFRKCDEDYVNRIEKILNNK